MKWIRWMVLGVGMALLAGCAPQYQVHSLGSVPLPSDTRPLDVAYFKMDAPHLQTPDLSAFTVRCDDPKVSVKVIGWKEGKEQRPQRRRLFSILIAWDQSSSLGDTDPERRRFPAGKQLISDLPNNARLGLVNFASLGFSYADYDVRAPMGSSKQQLMGALDYLNQQDFSMHGTPLWNTLYNAIPQFLAQEPAERERWVILFTDGQNDVPDFVASHTHQEALQVAQAHRVKLIFVLLGNEQTIVEYAQVRQTLEYMANATGGKVIAVDQAQDLREAFGEVLDILEYAPCYQLHLHVRKPGGFRRGETLTLRVQAAGGNERTVTRQM
ncbi:MAG: VWA domain-containing protein [Fimbriimonadales bacterium]|nr:VWA domain-containing protein [Fimbriimonadales bacterium]